MVSVFVVSCPNSPAPEIAKVPISGKTVNTEGRNPGEVFEMLADLGFDWCLDLGSANEEERYVWSIANAMIRIRRALANGKAVVLNGVQVGYFDVDTEFYRFIALRRIVPIVVEDNENSLVLGCVGGEPALCGSRE